tara:strand:+ start:369 stop:479 length:111 start_codon:yes stop_codon:yes gene_type:complete
MIIAKHILIAVVPVVVNGFWNSITRGKTPIIKIYRG